MIPHRSPLLLAVAGLLSFMATIVQAGEKGFLFRSTRPPLIECDCPRRGRRDLDCSDEREVCICMLRDFRSYYCDYKFCCTTQERRRKLLVPPSDEEPGGEQSSSSATSDAIWFVDDESEKDDDYKMYLEKCGSHDYEAHIYVDSHMYAYATPGPEATAAGCPFVVTHVEHEEGEASKQLILFPDIQQGLSMMKEKETAARSIGTFPLSRLADAYEQAHPASDSGLTSAYDAIANNCGHYMLHLGAALGVKINADIAQFVGRRLLQNAGQDLANKIRESASYFSLFPRRLGADDNINGAATAESDEHLISRLVETQAAGLM